HEWGIGKHRRSDDCERSERLSHGTSKSRNDITTRAGQRCSAGSHIRHDRKPQSSQEPQSFVVLYSVISGSKVHNDSVMKTTSNIDSRAIHMRATGSSGLSASNAAVPRTPAMITGTVIGYNRIGSMISRVRDRTSMAAKSVPTAANPIVPVSSRPVSRSG